MIVVTKYFWYLPYENHVILIKRKQLFRLNLTGMSERRRLYWLLFKQKLYMGIRNVVHKCTEDEVLDVLFWYKQHR